MDRRQKKLMDELSQLPKYSQEEKKERRENRLLSATYKLMVIDTLFRGMEALAENEDLTLDACFFEGVSCVTKSIRYDLDSGEGYTPAELWDYDLRDLEYVAIFKRNPVEKAPDTQLATE